MSHPEHRTLVTINDPDPTHNGRRSVIKVNGTRANVRGRMRNQVTDIAWIDPTYVAPNKSTFVVPYKALRVGLVKVTPFPLTSDVYTNLVASLFSQYVPSKRQCAEPSWFSLADEMVSLMPSKNQRR